VIANRNETHTITLSSLELVPSTTMMYLEDRETGNFINLRSQSAYAFELGSMDVANRFAIHFSAPVQISGVAASCDVNAGSIQVSNPSSEAVTYSIVKDNELVATATSTEEAVSFDNLSEGVYQVSMVFNGGYSTTIQTEISGAIQTNVAIFSAATTLYAGEAASFEASANGTISWFLNDLNQPIGQGTNIEIPFEQAGIYTLIARAENGPCSSTSAIEVNVRADVATAIAPLNASDVVVAPNPAKETISIRFNGTVKSEKATIQLIDLTGKIVMTEQAILNSGALTLSLNGIDAGIYMLNIHSNSMHSASKLVVQ
jgi:PKD repeat protein